MQKTALEIRFHEGSQIINWQHPEGVDAIDHFAASIAPQLVTQISTAIPPAPGFLAETYCAEEEKTRRAYFTVANIVSVSVATEEDIEFFVFMWNEGVEHRRAHRQQALDGHPRIAAVMDEDSDKLYVGDVAYQPVPTAETVMQLRADLLIAIDGGEADEIELALTKLGLGL